MPAMRRPVRRARLVPMTLFGGHLGSLVSALVDGQLDEATAERAWQHVSTCAPCRGLVEREGVVKRRLAQVAEEPRDGGPSARLLGSLLDLDPAAVAWAEAREAEQAGRSRRRAGIALVGVGSVSAAVLGLTALGGTPPGLGGGGGAPTAQIGRVATSTPFPVHATVGPAAAVHGRLPGYVLGTGSDGVARGVAVDDRP